MNSTDQDTVNIPVGVISPEARAAILACGGRIEATKKPSVSMVVLPEGAEELSSNADHAYIALPDASESVLHFTRAWQTEDCSLDLCK